MRESVENHGKRASGRLGTLSSDAFVPAAPIFIPRLSTGSSIPDLPVDNGYDEEDSAALRAIARVKLLASSPTVNKPRSPAPQLLHQFP